MAAEQVVETTWVDHPFVIHQGGQTKRCAAGTVNARDLMNGIELSIDLYPIGTDPNVQH